MKLWPRALPSTSDPYTLTPAVNVSPIKSFGGPHPMVNVSCNRFIVLILRHQPMCFGLVSLQWERSGMRQLTSETLITGASPGAADLASPFGPPNLLDLTVNDTLNC